MRTINLIGLSFFWLSLCLQQIHGYTLTPPTDISSTRVLPKGVRNLRLKGLYISANDKFDNYGQTRLLADPFFANVTFEDMIDPTNADPAEKGLLKGYLESNNFSMGDSVGKTNGAVSVSAQVSVPVFAYGITSDVTLAVAIPIIHYRVNAMTGFTPSAQTIRLHDQLKNEGKVFEANKMQEKLYDPIGVKLADFGYNPLVSKSDRIVGDIKLIGKVSLIDDGFYAMTFKPEISLPTGPEQDPHSVLPTPGARGPLAFGAGLIQSITPNPAWENVFSFGVQQGMRRFMAARIPYLAKSKLTPYVDNNTEHDPGVKFNAEIGSRYQFDSGFAILGNYFYQYKEKDSYVGSVYNPQYYKYLEVDTRQSLSTVQASLAFNTLGHFKNKNFPVPFEVSINHIRSTSGKNVSKDPLTTLEFAVFF